MADLKISQMQDGGLVEVSDEIPVNRAGVNYRVVVGSAASSDANDFATAAQGGLAETAIQPDDLGTAAYENIDYFATAAQGELADSAIQPDDLIASNVSQTQTSLGANVQSAIDGLKSSVEDITIGVNGYTTHSIPASATALGAQSTDGYWLFRAVNSGTAGIAQLDSTAYGGLNILQTVAVNATVTIIVPVNAGQNCNIAYSNLNSGSSFLRFYPVSR